MKKLLLLFAVILWTAQAFSVNTATITLNGTTYSSITLAIAASTSESDIINISAGTVSEKVTFTKSLTINGAGMGLTTISPPTSTVVIASSTSFSAAASVTLSNLTISGGSSTTSGGGMAFNVTAGTSLLTVNLTNLKITSNSTSSTTGGGGIYASGLVALNITGCNITGNTSSGTGGGVYVNPGANYQANLTIKNSTISGNSSALNGAGVAVNCGGNGSNTSAVNSLWVENTTIYGNNITTASPSTKIGGGIYYRTCNSSGNTAHTNKITLNHCTIVNNNTNFGTTSSTLAGPDGVGVENSGGWSTTLVMNNSIIMGNTGSTGSYNCQVGSNNTANLPATNGKITNGGINNCIFNPVAGATWVTAATTNNKLDAVLADLVFGGSLSSDATPVLKMGGSSIARNYVTTNYLSPALTTDELGLSRDATPDAGAYEFNDLNTAVNTPTQANTVIVTGRELHFSPVEGLVEVYSQDGRLVKTKYDAKSTMLLNNGGVYIVKMNSSQGVHIQKIIVY
jgi:hypothetical protein